MTFTKLMTKPSRRPSFSLLKLGRIRSKGEIKTGTADGQVRFRSEDVETYILKNSGQRWPYHSHAANWWKP